MARTRAEYDVIRAANRGALGLAGLPRIRVAGLGADIGVLGAAVQGVNVNTSFPDTDLTWIPGQDAPAEGMQPGASDWIMRHVIRPQGAIITPAGPIAWNPYENDADYSGIAKILAALLGAGIAFGTAWLIIRALWPTRRLGGAR